MTQPETAAPAKSGLPKFVKRAIWIVIALVGVLVQVVGDLVARRLDRR